MIKKFFTLYVLSILCLIGLSQKAFSDADSEKFVPFVSTLGTSEPAAMKGMISDNTALFIPQGMTLDNIAVNPGILNGKLDSFKEGLSETCKLIPCFFKDSDTTFSAFISVDKSVDIYGTGEVTAPFRRNGTKTICWDFSNYGYSQFTQPLYQAYPFVLGVNPDGSSFGIWAMTTYHCTVDMTVAGIISFTARANPGASLKKLPEFAVMTIEAETPQKVISIFTDLTGRMPMQPKWALGFQQSRYAPMTQDYILNNVAKKFRENRVPCDVVWMDIDYMDMNWIFTFNPERIPEPSVLMNKLHEIDFKGVWMIDPGLPASDQKVFFGKTEGYRDYIYKSGNEIKTDGLPIWVLKSDKKTPFIGDVWADSEVFPDFTMPEARNWWESLYKNFMLKGIDGVWNDMNEPEIFGTPMKSMPLSNIHRGGALPDGRILPEDTHDRYHNVYGMLEVMASREGILKANPDKRPFLLSRANYIGGQRYAAMWTGDIPATWDAMVENQAMLLNIGLSGQPFCGPDLGGFTDNCDAKLYSRWIGVGALYPFSRAHKSGHPDTVKEAFPWSYDNATLDSVRLALERRYRLIPYLYTLFAQSSLSGEPVMKPIFMADVKNPHIRSEYQSFLIGNDLLVLPDFTTGKPSDAGNYATPAEPTGRWRSFSLVDGDLHDVNQPKLKIRGGSIIPAGRIIQSTTENSFDPLTLFVCPQTNGHAEGYLYLDEGDGFNYEKGKYLYIKISADQYGEDYRITFTKLKGTMDMPEYEVEVKVLVSDYKYLIGNGTFNQDIVIGKEG